MTADRQTITGPARGPDWGPLRVPTACLLRMDLAMSRAVRLPDNPVGDPSQERLRKREGLQRTAADGLGKNIAGDLLLD